MIEEALSTYDIAFFKQFSFTGTDGQKLAQRGLEEYILNLESNTEVEKLLLAMIH